MLISRHVRRGTPSFLLSSRARAMSDDRSRHLPLRANVRSARCHAVIFTLDEIAPPPVAVPGRDSTRECELSEVLRISMYQRSSGSRSVAVPPRFPRPPAPLPRSGRSGGERKGDDCAVQCMNFFVPHFKSPFEYLTALTTEDNAINNGRAAATTPSCNWSISLN